MVNSLLIQAREELAQRLGVSPGYLDYIGLLDYPAGEKVYLPLFTVLDKRSRFYLSTRAAKIFLQWDENDNCLKQAQDFFIADIDRRKKKRHAARH